MKRPKKPPQHIIHYAGGGVGVTFTWAAESRVQKKAARLGISVDELLTRSIDRRLRASTNVKQETSDLVDVAIKALAAPPKRRKAG